MSAVTGGVATVNPFDFLDEDGGDLPPPSAQPEPAAAKPVQNKAAVQKAGGQPVAAQVSQPTGVEARLRGPGNEGRGRGDRGRGDRGGRGGDRGGRGGRGGGRGFDRPERQGQGGPPTENGVGGDGEQGERGRGRGGFRGRGRGGDDGGRRRNYDRYDVTGRSHETEKRHGAGKGNWGNEADDITAAGKPAAEAATPEGGPTGENSGTAAGADWDGADPTPAEAESAKEGDKEADPAADAAPAEAAAEPAEPAAIREEDKPNMTLAEYEELQKKNKAPKAVKIVKEGTKEDFSDMTPFTRKDRTADTDVLKLSNKKEISARKAGTNERERKTAKEVVETGFRVDDGQRSERGGRGGRGGREGGRGEFRGRGDRDNFRGGRDSYRENERPSRGPGGRGPGGRGRGSNSAAPQINDEAAFPGLA